MKLTDEQCLIRDSVRDYVQNRIAPHAAEWDKSGHFPAEQLKEMGELGLFGMVIPEQGIPCRGNALLRAAGALRLLF